MKIKEIKKGDWIINTKVPNAKPWIVCYKYAGFVAMSRSPKKGKLTAITDCR